MDEQNPNPNPAPQIISDVVRPGQSPPSPSSKPIIPSNEPSRPDPMMYREPTHPPAAINSLDGLTPTHTQAEISPQVLPAQPLPAAVQITQPDKAPKVHHRLKIMLPLIAGIIVLFIIADLLVDAGVIHTSITPLTHFFHHH